MSYEQQFNFFLALLCNLPHFPYRKKHNPQDGDYRHEPDKGKSTHLAGHI
jgi:hypothetical protein